MGRGGEKADVGSRDSVRGGQVPLATEVQTGHGSELSWEGSNSPKKEPGGREERQEAVACGRSTGERQET